MKYYPSSYYIIIILLAVTACSSPSIESSKLTVERLTGKTMGTTFNITYLDSTAVDLVKPIKTLLTNINRAVSTYVPDSEISQFNKGDSLLVNNVGHFARNYQLAKKIYHQTNRWFNPTVMPLVNYWGFGYTKKELPTNISQAKVDSLLQLVNFDTLQIVAEDSTLLFIKPMKGIELDFSAIAKGDAVDEIGRLLEKNNIHNYFVEIGGEVRTRGRTIKGFPWRTGIRKPKEKSRIQNLQMVVELKDMALATSGNYENYHIEAKTGLKYAHTINPHTGYPEKNSLLSASVFATDCATADAFATAFMAMGLEKAWKLAQQLEGIEVYLIYADNSGNLKEKMTDAVKAMQ